MSPFSVFVSHHSIVQWVLLGSIALVVGCGGLATSNRSDPDEMDETDGESPEDHGPPAVETGVGGSVVVSPATGGAPTQEPMPSGDCLIDEQTGLMWEVKAEDPADLRYEGFTYSWYQTSSEELLRGVEDNGACGFPPCNTEKYVEGVNFLSLCGFSDWRLPKLDELLSLAPPEAHPPGMPSGDEPFYWSASQTDAPGAAWGAYLCCGGVEAPAQKSGAGFVRLVRTL